MYYIYYIDKFNFQTIFNEGTYYLLIYIPQVAFDYTQYPEPIKKIVISKLF